MSLYFKGEEQTLSDILKARETRVEYQQYLLNKYVNTIVAYKLNIPGPVKYSSLIKKIFDEGLDTLVQKLEEIKVDVLHEKVWYKNSGPEYFGVFDVPAELIKKLTTSIEEMHPLGRLYDFDVLDSVGKQISREDLHMEPRKCLLCNKNAFECGRSRSHGVGELVDKIEQMALEYFSSFNKE